MLPLELVSDAVMGLLSSCCEVDKPLLLIVLVYHSINRVEHFWILSAQCAELIVTDTFVRAVLRCSAQS